MDCDYCEATGEEACDPSCRSLLCDSCGGAGWVIDYSQRIGDDVEDGRVVATWYWGKRCSCGAAPAEESAPEMAEVKRDAALEG